MPNSGSLQRHSVNSAYEINVTMGCLDSADGSLCVDCYP